MNETMIYLDDPAYFGIWGKIKIDQIPMFRTWLCSEHNISKLTAHQAFTQYVKHGELTQIYVDYGWLEIPHLLKNMPDFVEPDTSVAAVSTINPSRSAKFCSEH
ncbi:hypothetical protein ACO0LG_15985 [Undibacterium sp. Ji42W]|uniref:hypothetical protein n=1 Tax=Undibacterium sp. Ji42W TaxID=3413039 RepID=UPI003BF1D8A9